MSQSLMLMVTSVQTGLVNRRGLANIQILNQLHTPTPLYETSIIGRLKINAFSTGLINKFNNIRVNKLLSSNNNANDIDNRGLSLYRSTVLPYNPQTSRIFQKLYSKHTIKIIY